MDRLPSNKTYYTTVFSQCFSPCGKYLVAGNNYGEVGVFNVNNIINPDSSKVQDENCKYPVYTFTAHNGPVYAMVSTEKFLVTAGIGDILGWCWSDVLNKASKVAWSLPVPQGDSVGQMETNAIVIDKKDNVSTLFSGGGDNNVYVWDLETGKQQNTLHGHADYVHCLALGNTRNDCISGSEDGTVRIWDTRSKMRETARLEPYKNEACARPKFGKWVGCVAVDAGDDWLVCGGGPSLALWHLRSHEPTTAFSVMDASLSWCGFQEDLIIAGGGDSYFYHLNYNGDLRAKIPTSASSIYSIAISDSSQNHNQNQILTAAGSSYKIDVCASLKYRDFIIMFDR